MRSRPIRRAGQLHSGVTHPGVTPFDASPTDILDAIKAAIIITDSVGVIRYINPFAKQLYGWSLHEVIGRNIMEIAVSKENKEQAEEHMAALKAGDSWAGEFQVRCKDGRYVTAMVTLSPLFDEDGNTTTIVGISLDMSGRQRVEDALREARAELETRVQERSAELERANERLRNLSARLLQLRDHEGRRLARELHDSVGQLLTAITIDIATVQSQAGKLDQNGAKAIEDSALLVQQISSEIRTISHLLHPPLLDEVGLPSALGWYLDGFAGTQQDCNEVGNPR